MDAAKNGYPDLMVIRKQWEGTTHLTLLAPIVHLNGPMPFDCPLVKTDVNLYKLALATAVSVSQSSNTIHPMICHRYLDVSKLCPTIRSGSLDKLRL